MQHRGVVAAAETPSDLRQERGVITFDRYMATCRGLTMVRVRRLDSNSVFDTL